MLDTILQIWSRHRWWLIAGFVFGISTTASLIYSLPALYRASTTILIGQDAIAGSLVTPDRSSQLDQRLHMIRQELLSREQLLTLIERFNLYQRMRESQPTEVILARMRQDISISQSTTSQVSLQRGQAAPMVVRISYQGWSADEAADVTNTLAELYRDRYERIRFGQATRTTEFLREQLEDVEQRLAIQEEDIEDFRKKNLGQLPQQERMNLATLERLNSDLRLNRERQLQLLNRHNQAQSNGSGAVVNVAGESRLDRLRRELIVLSARYNASHPSILRLQSEISELEETPVPTEGLGEIVPEISAPEELRRLTSEEANLRSAIDALQQRLQMSPEIEQTLNQMTNAYNTIREEHLALQRRFQEARFLESLESQQTQQFQVLERALPPAFSSAPNRPRLMLMAFILTLAGLGGLLFLAEQMKRTFYGTHDLKAFTSVPVIASIGSIRTRGEKIRKMLVSLALAIVFVIGVVLISEFLYSNGQNAKGLVWLTAGNNA